MSKNSQHRAGFVSIVGMPNVGKSTLMNALVGEKMSIVTSKVQTTRHRIMGIWNDDEVQIVFSDTPGFINQPAYKLHQSMNAFVQQTFEDADVILFITDKTQSAEKQSGIAQLLQATKTPVLLVLNKSDITGSEQIEGLRDLWKEKLPMAEFISISALQKKKVKELLKRIIEKLPEHPPYYDKDELTDRPMRFFASEIVREKIFLNYEQEIPYSCEVGIDTYRDEPEIVRIKALIFVSRKSQKSIVIGKGGLALKKVGTAARKDLEDFLGKKVFLELHVKVREKWRDNEHMLKRLGYGR